MEEDADVNAAPVTRLRRRLSVEADETKSPLSTPTKKRSNRLAAKPQLELIDEHAVTNSPKRTTRKSISREIAEPEKKPVTPARRSTRTKSNTSLVSEAEEKPVTPARRNTNVKSNTSIVSEAAQNVETPRAKRAIARRNSQVGSDTETTLTPKTRRTRKTSTSSIDKEETLSVSESAVTPGRTRRTRKGSTSSIDTPAEAVQAEKPPLITEVIPEEPEEKRKSSNNSENVDSSNDSPTRRSPRLLAKKGRTSQSESETPTKSQESRDHTDNMQVTTSQENFQDKKAVTETISKNDISIASANLIEDLDKKLKSKINKNKSMSDVEDNTLDSKKRNRTKSWTTISTSSPPVEGNFYSDNESVKKKIKKHGKIFKDKGPMNVGSGDGSQENSAEQNNNAESFETSMKKKNNRKSSITNSSRNLSSSEITKEVNISSESNKENILAVVKNASELLFEKAPNGDIQTMVFIEDSDSNTGSESKKDQCVPVVLHEPVKSVSNKQENNDNIFAINNTSQKDSNNDSVEPMDIDETIPENISLTDFSEQGKQSRKTSLCISENTDSKNAHNKSKRKSSVTYSVSQIIDTYNKKDIERQQIQPSTSSLNISHHNENESLTINHDESKKVCLLYDSMPKDNKVGNEEIKADKHNISMNESKSGKKSRKSSLGITQDSNSSKDSNKVEEETLDRNDISKDKHQEFSISDIQGTDTSNTKRKASLSNSISSDMEKTENKSTLVLSQLRDNSTAENSVLSPQKKEKSLSINIAEPVNKNLNVKYTTSTPVQQKNQEKLAIQMNTSVITPSNESKKEYKLSGKSPKHVSVSKSTKKESSDEESGNSDESEELSHDDINFFDDKAKDAGNDYSSGDSQDEEDRQYAKEHEIVDKGETLTTDEDISNDSDYEKDSFIVSSDEEDKELLSGSGDDLDMSDNELTLSAKSKKKYNERKIKEQKKASKEMYEARHGLNLSNKHIKSNKSNRNRLDSTLLKSDEDIKPPKKNKRMRLESTLENTEDSQGDSADVETKEYMSIASENAKIGYIKKKVKRLSESICDESIINEKEITVPHEMTTQKEDPLSVHIKAELKTPLKDLEISRVHIADDVEQVQIDENASMIIANETKDPLQATLMNNDGFISDDEESISENEEIANNYDSVLKALNEDRNKLVKSRDISLNLNKKEKKKPKEAIVYELNLTQTKSTRKDTSSTAKEKSIKRVFKKLADSDDASSDCIDLKLLFSDESNGCDKGDEPKEKMTEDTEETFIPLKKSEAKTDIHKNMESCVNRDEDEGSQPFNFFIDTKGDLSGKEKSNNEESDSDGPPMEVLYAREKKIKKDSVDNKINSSLNKTQGSPKKKKRISETMEPEVPNTPGREKNNTAETNEEKLFSELAPKTPMSAKKTNKMSQSQEQTTTEQDTNTFVNDITCSSRKRKRQISTNESFDSIEFEDTQNTSQDLTESRPGNKKKKVKTSNSVDTQTQGDLTAGEIVQKTDVKEIRSKRTTKSKHIDIEHTVAVQESEPQKVNKKRKERDDDEGAKISKVFKENSFDKVHVQRLPPSIVEQLGDRPNLYEKKKIKVVSTSNFLVEETKRRKTKPSDFLEESVYLNNETDETIMKKKTNLKIPKVLPFIPTASTSDSGFTTNFHVNVISSKIEFVAKKNDVPNFKNDYLNNKKIKKMRTYDLLKKQRIAKLSKF